MLSGGLFRIVSSTSLALSSRIATQLTKSVDCPPSTALTDDSNSPLLSVAPVSTNPPDSNEMSISAKVSLVLEAEQEIRNLERDLRDIETLNQRGVVEAGKLPGKLYL